MHIKLDEQRINIDIKSSSFSLGQTVAESIRSSFQRLKIAISMVPKPIPQPARVEPEAVTKLVWIKGNLVSTSGKYFPQLTLHTEAHETMLEAAVAKLRDAGFEENEWLVARESGRFCLRRRAPYTNPQEGYIALSGMVWEACRRTGLQYANLAA